MLDNSLRDEGMDCLNYSATIIAWAANVNTPNSIGKITLLDLQKLVTWKINLLN